MENISFHHILPLQLRFNDFDQFGHVNNTVYFSYFDLGKSDYFLSVCNGLDWKKEGVMVVHIDTDFLAQTFGSEPIAVQTAILEIGTKSLTLIQRVINSQTKEVKSICRSIMVYFNIEKKESQPVPEKWVNIISSYEGRNVRKSDAKQ